LIGTALAAAWLAMAAPPALETAAVTVVAHRGLARAVPENTLAAFRRSIADGVAVIELDVRATRDGRLVIHHDETLDRTTDCSGSIAQQSFEQVRSCDAGRGERVPSLSEALAFIQGKPARLLLDIKPGTRLDRVISEIRSHRAEAKVIVGLRRARDIARVRRELPGTTALAFMPDVRDAAAFVDAGAQIIRLWSDWVEADPALVGRTQALGPKAWIMVGRRLPARDQEWRRLHARMIASGAQGLITDRPDLISDP
jgi:glycerophosphoryl diester phosphodiesterase